jgi:hypothetical protein
MCLPRPTPRRCRSADRLRQHWAGMRAGSGVGAEGKTESERRRQEHLAWSAPSKNWKQAAIGSEWSVINDSRRRPQGDGDKGPTEEPHMRARMFPRILFAVLSIALASAAGACINPLNWISYIYPSLVQVPEGPTQLSVSFHYVDSSLYCGLANVQMWSEFKGNPTTQPSILNHMLTYYSSPYVETNGSMSPEGVALAATAFVPGTAIVATDYYVPDLRLAIADQHMNLERGEPTIVINEAGTHSVLLKGASWHKMSDLRPAVDYVWYHDPSWSGGASIACTVSEWMNTVGTRANYVMITSIQRADTFSSSSTALSEFDAWGGTYYGDPAPPECPNCEEQALADTPLPFLPAMRLVTRLAGGLLRNRVSPMASTTDSATQPQAPARNRSSRAAQGVRKEIFVPRPNATDARGIALNLWEGLKQTRMYQIPGWDKLNPSRREVVVGRTDFVHSLGNHPDYHLLRLDNLDGTPYALAAVSVEGWLLAVTVLTNTIPDLSQTEDWAKTVVSEDTGKEPLGVRRVHAYSSAIDGPSVFRPFWEVDSIEGTLLVNHRGQVFAERDGEKADTDPRPFLLRRGRVRPLSRLTR